MAPENRADWENFVGSADIQPLGTAYGYQLEIPFEEPRLFWNRTQRFFDDPRNIRGLIGDISTDSQGRIRRDFDVTTRNAIQAKRGIRDSPKLMQDLNRLVNESGGGFSSMAGLEDAYSLRQLFGEQPSEYGDPAPSRASTDPRGVYSSELGYRTRYRSNEPTFELSPAERTTATSPLLRPDVLASDLTFLESPIVTSEVYDRGQNRVPLRALETLNRAIRGLSSGGFDNPIDLDASRNTDNEGLRRLIRRGVSGIITVGSDLPGEFAENLQNLLERDDADANYIYDYLRDAGNLPDEAREPWQSDLEDEGYDVSLKRKKTGWDIRNLAETYPEQERVLTGSSSGSRVGATQLTNEYGRYLPDAYEKLSLKSAGEVSKYFQSLQDPNAEKIANYFPRDVVEYGPVGAVANAFNRTVANIQNLDKKYEAVDYLDKFLKDLDNKMVSVPVRSAGVGGGDYLNRFELEELFPKAAQKLEFFGGGEAYVPDYFEPKISQTFYSSSGTPYHVEINRDPGYESLDLNRPFSANVGALLEDKPYAGLYNIDFTVNGNYSDAGVPDELKQDIMGFVKKNARQGIPAGAVLRNAPMRNESGRTGKHKGNKRSLWYQQLGFGAETPEGQFGYIDPDTGNTVPIQPYKTDPFSQGLETYKRSYYSTFVPGVTPETINRIAGDIKRTPWLLPGVADLIPSAEAVRRGYQEGPEAMGQQMAEDFVAGLPVAAAAAPILSSAPLAPLAPGIGLGLVGLAGAEALNTAVDEATGKPLIQRVQEVAGKAAPGVMGKPERPNRYEIPERFRRDLERIQNPPQVKPATRVAPKPQNELQRRIQMAGQRFNPRRGEFGLTELLFGR